MNFKFPVLFLLVAMVALASCKVNNDAPSAESSLTTRVNVVNATTDTLNLYLNGRRINTSSSLYPAGYTGLLTVPYSDQTYQVKKYASSATLFPLPLSLDTGKVYSLFLTGEDAEHAFTTVDTLTADTSSKKFRIRFVNASPGPDSLTVTMNDTIRFRGRLYKSTSVFLSVGVGPKRIRVFKSGTAVALSDTTRTLLGGKVYTLFSKGTLTGTSASKFGTGMVVNR